jgi:hypothetical protein
MDKHPEEESPQEETLATPGVLDKYQAAGKICNGKGLLISYSFLKLFSKSSSRNVFLVLTSSIFANLVIKKLKLR